MQLTPALRMKPLVEKGTTTNTLTLLLDMELLPTEHHFKSTSSPLLTELLFSDVRSYLNHGRALLQMVTIPKYITFVHRLFSVFGYFSLG